MVAIKTPTTMLSYIDKLTHPSGHHGVRIGIGHMQLLKLVRKQFAREMAKQHTERWRHCARRSNDVFTLEQVHLLMVAA